MPDNKSTFQAVWGGLLTAAGISVFFRTQQVMPKLAEIESLANKTGVIRFCVYFMGLMLIVGGVRKLVAYFGKPDAKGEAVDPTENE